MYVVVVMTCDGLTMQPGSIYYLPASGDVKARMISAILLDTSRVVVNSILRPNQSNGRGDDACIHVFRACFSSAEAMRLATDVRVDVCDKHSASTVVISAHRGTAVYTIHYGRA